MQWTVRAHAWLNHRRLGDHRLSNLRPGRLRLSDFRLGGLCLKYRDGRLLSERLRSRQRRLLSPLDLRALDSLQLTDLPVAQSAPQVLGIDIQHLADVVEGKHPLLVFEIDPLFRVAEQALTLVSG